MRQRVITRQRMINIPNAITLARILLVPLFLSLLAEGSNKMALCVFVAAGLSDGIDGTIARLTDTRTTLGAHLDPLADKLLLVSAYIALAILGMIPQQLMIFVLVRDAVILGGFLLSAAVVGRSIPMNPSIWGKMTTFLQISAVTLVLLDRSTWLLVPARYLDVVFVATSAACVVSGAGYVIDGIRWYQSIEPGAGVG